MGEFQPVAARAGTTVLMKNNKVSLCMVIHSHQPVGNFDHVIEDSYQKAYLPFLRALERHPRIRLSLHYSGILWAWIEAHHSEFMTLMRELTARNQVEHVGGGFFEPILVSIPDSAKAAQIRRQHDYLKKVFGAAPRGAWVTERVWEQGLIAPLAQAGAEYVMLDDSHFLSTGEDPADMHQAFLTEESGARLALVPSLQSLRYTIPFRNVEETLAILREGMGDPNGLFAVGDDCEKFGAWPGTYEHCYTKGWLDQFFQAIEGAESWLEATTISDYLAAHPPARRIYLPTASYAEMMTWALPAHAAEEFAKCLEASEASADGIRSRRFLRGAPWRNFLCKYPEANQFQKLMTKTYGRLEAAQRSAAADGKRGDLLAQAEEYLLASQCNDAYWHGFFGGLYAPHLRSAIEKRLIQAESILDAIESPSAGGATIEVEDFDVDGSEELMANSSAWGAIIRPADGGTISSLRSKAMGVELINSLARRPEAYHRLVREKIQHHMITGESAPKNDTELDLAALLQYDRYARHAFRTYVFSREKSWGDFQALHLEESVELAQGRWRVATMRPQFCSISLQKIADHLASGPATCLEVKKKFTLKTQENGWTLGCRHAFATQAQATETWALGVEVVLNRLAPNSPDRYFRAGDERHPLAFKGELRGEKVTLVDEWQRLEITLAAPGAARWWITPIETISQSESGFERIYQGSAIMVVWNLNLAPATRYDLKMGVRSLG